MNHPYRDLRVLIAGCGSIGRRHARVLRSLGVRRMWACDPAAEARAALAAETRVARRFDSFRKALDAGPDAVFVCTPPRLHIPMSIQALRAGADVFCEKPLADSLEGTEDLAEAIRETRKRFMVGFCFRYHEGLTRAKACLDAGRIGRLVSVLCRMGEHLPTVRPDYRDLFTVRYSGAFDLTHEIDLACWFAGDAPIAEVKALHGQFSDLDMEAPDVVEILIRFGDACLASVHLDFFSRPRMRVTELLGTEGTIRVEFPTWEQCVFSVWRASTERWETETLSTERDEMFRAEDAEFLNLILGEGAVRVGLAEACKSMRVVCAAQAGELPPARDDSTPDGREAPAQELSSVGRLG